MPRLEGSLFLFTERGERGFVGRRDDDDDDEVGVPLDLRDDDVRGVEREGDEGIADDGLLLSISSRLS